MNDIHSPHQGQGPGGNANATDPKQSALYARQDLQHTTQSPRHHVATRKRPFIDAFTVAFDESRSPELPERHYQFFDKYISPARKPSPNKQLAGLSHDDNVLNTSSSKEYVDKSLTENDNDGEESDTTSEKFTALVQTMGACAYAGADFFSSVLLHGTKSIYSFINTTYQENVQQNKRRRINSDASILKNNTQHPFPQKNEQSIPIDSLFPDPIQFSSSNNQKPIDAQNLVASPVSKIPGSFHWNQDTPTTKKPAQTSTLTELSNEPTKSVYFKRQMGMPSDGLFTPFRNKILQNPQFSSLPPGSPMDIDTTFDLKTPQKQVTSTIGPVPKTFKPAVTPSFDFRTRTNKVVPDSPLKQPNSESNVKVLQLFDGLRRHRLGILNHTESHPSPNATSSPLNKKFASVHGGGSSHSVESPSKYTGNSVLSSPGVMRAFRFDEKRLSTRRPLPYAASWYYTPPRVELPEQAPSSEIYAQAYMALVARREKLARDVEQLRKTEEEEQRRKKAQEGVPLLDPKSVHMVESLWSRRDEATELVFAYRIGISVYDLRTLRDGQWLNDNIIDFYLSMISERSKESNGQLPACFAFSTHFFSTLQTRGYSGVARWAKRKGIDVTKQDFIFVPINRHNTHWCLAVINNRDMRFEFYDSMNGAGSTALDLLRDYMYSQTKSTYPDSNLDEMGYDKYDMCSTLQCPQQKNSFDCGVFVSKMVEVISRNKDIMSFSQKDMPNIRRRMAFEITEQHLLT